MAFKSKPSAAIGLSGSPTTISDTVASGATHTIIGLSLANVNTSTVTASVKINKSGGASAFLVKDALVPVGGALVVIGGDQKLVIEAGDSVTAYASASSSIDAVVSYLV
jgi:hypothetical protein